jgi:hypothetical protein
MKISRADLKLPDEEHFRQSGGARTRDHRLSFFALQQVRCASRNDHQENLLKINSKKKSRARKSPA